MSENIEEKENNEEKGKKNKDEKSFLEEKKPEFVEYRIKLVNNIIK